MSRAASATTPATIAAANMARPMIIGTTMPMKVTTIANSRPSPPTPSSRRPATTPTSVQICQFRYIATEEPSWYQ